ncbi:aldehyde-activating protein [Veronia nyctiphanis]|uniref:Aldehyde-activating protein n=1 Tax=Veronia nyctiphanis TaxID=1278244 RepID=A0A4Q0YTA1_9GAMM|nr:GFA family protein [Veronia nyctiphanis]RXJ74440.1 aldehyde-activating protein [Veronia nyctiphanis]
MYKASCFCGKVTLDITGPISHIIHCHCSLCRKSSGTAYATNGFVDTEHLVITSGEEVLSYFERKPGKKRHFCSSCGSPIFSSNEADPSRVRLRLGLLDTDITERPESHNFVTSRANWEDMDTHLPRYKGHEPSRDK